MASSKDKGDPKLEDVPAAASFRSVVWDQAGIDGMAVRKWWINLWQCASNVQQMLLMLAATHPTHWLICGDVTPICQLTAQGRVSLVGKNNFYSSHLLNSLSVKSQTG